MAFQPIASSSLTRPAGLTEFDILKENHKFLREDTDEGNASWEDKLASKYYSSLYREFAVCDLKHYKSGNFALRWRTEEEVISGSGETTCGNTRCQHHTSPGVPLTTLELPFTYLEHAETKTALVKVVLCQRCVGKLMWKRRKDKQVSEEGKKAADEDYKTRRRNSRSRSPKSRRRHSRSRSQERKERSRRDHTT